MRTIIINVITIIKYCYYPDIVAMLAIMNFIS